MSQPLPHLYRTAPRAPAPVIPGSTRLILISAAQEELLEIHIPPSTSALAPDIPLLPLIRARYMAEVAPLGLDPARVLFLVGKDAGVTSVERRAPSRTTIPASRGNWTAGI